MRPDSCLFNCAECPVSSGLIEQLQAAETIRRSLAATSLENIRGVAALQDFLSDAFTSRIDSGVSDESAYRQRFAAIFNAKAAHHIREYGDEVEEQFKRLDQSDDQLRNRLERIQTTCSGPIERKKYILFGAKAISCSSPWALTYDRMTLPEAT